MPQASLIEILKKRQKNRSTNRRRHGVEDPPSEPEERGPYVVGNRPDVVIRNTSGQKDEKRRSHCDYWRTQRAPRIRLDVAGKAA